jgi:hypothetical protein
MIRQKPVFVTGVRGSPLFFIVFFNPIKYIDPTGRYLINTASALDFVNQNPKTLNRMQFQPNILASINGKLTPVNVHMLSPFASIRLDVRLEKAVNNIIKIRNENNKLIKTSVTASATYIGEGVYQVNVQVTAIMSNPLTGEQIILENETKPVAFSTGIELGVTPFSAANQDSVNAIANEVLAFSKTGVKVDE